MSKIIQDIVIAGAGTAGLISALIINRKFPDTNITIVKSDKVGIIGVGEGSTEHWQRFLDFVDISKEELIARAGATLKIGIEFKKWASPYNQFMHSVDYPVINARGAEFNRIDEAVLLTPTKHQVQPHLVPYLECSAPLSSEIEATQFHFNTFRLNTFLLNKCKERGIKIEDAIINDVVLDDDGFISEVLCDNNVTFKGDFFIDCTGLKRVLSSKVGIEWVPYRKHLPMNHAVAFPTAHGGDHYPAFTTATLLSKGWAWKIPTQDGYGNGYVFNDAYISVDDALRELADHLEIDTPKDFRDIKFEAGRVDKFWNKNCISLGLASSFAEPLEAQSIGFTILQCFGFIDNVEAWTANSTYIEKLYNTAFIESFDNIVSFIQAHYLKANYLFDENQESPWNFELTDFNKETRSMFEQGHIYPSFFEGRYLMFKAYNWYQLYSGLNMINQVSPAERFVNSPADYTSYVHNSVQEYINNNCNIKTIEHGVFIKLIADNYNSMQ